MRLSVLSRTASKVSLWVHFSALTGGKIRVSKLKQTLCLLYCLRLKDLSVLSHRERSRLAVSQKYGIVVTFLEILAIENTYEYRGIIF